MIEKEKSQDIQITNKKNKNKVSLRGNKKFRLTIIIILMVIIGVLFFVWEKARIFLVIAFITLLTAFGLEVSENDWDIGTLFETKSFKESKIMRDDSGNFLYDLQGDITTDTVKGKKADEYNCEDFSTQPSAQNFFEKVGGVGNDVNRLDGDKDSVACEALPAGAR